MKTNNNKQSQLNIKICKVSNLDEIGGWASVYTDVPMRYQLEGYQTKYSDIAFCVKGGKNVLGYVMAYSVVVDKSDIFVPTYGKKLVIYDFAIIANDSEGCASLLIDYLLDYAANDGFNGVEVKQNNGSDCFVNFLCDNYNAQVDSGSCYVVISDTRVPQADKYLAIYKDDKVALDDVYFLRDLNFVVEKETIFTKFTNGETITIDRKSAKIIFPQSVKYCGNEIYLSSKSRNLIYWLCQLYQDREKYNAIAVHYDASQGICHMFVDGCIYVDKSVNSIANNLSYVLSLRDCDIMEVVAYPVDYNMHDRSFNTTKSKLTCDQLVEMYNWSCMSEGENMFEKIKEKKKAVEFNKKLENIVRFDFIMGNPFFGMKKLSILFGDEVEIKTNSRLPIEEKVSKKEIIKYLQQLYFSKWNYKYDSNPRPSAQNAWTITLVFEDETLMFYGWDDYPACWKNVEWFVGKYGNFSFDEE